MARNFGRYQSSDSQLLQLKITRIELKIKLMGSPKNSAVKLLTSFVVVFLLAHQTQQAPIFECGRSEFRSRMVGGGSEAMANEFPWMAHLLIRRGDGQLFHCGGTLISDSHVLTATHCVVHNETKIHDVLAITLGTNVIAREGSSQDLDWKKIVIPAGVELTGPDIAIVTLSKPVAFTDSVRPACLPFANDTDHVNDPVVLTGWGEYNSSGSVMRKIQASVLPGGQCRETASRAVLSDGFLICTEHRPGQHCNGDDGGPMNYYNAELDRWFVLGVAGRGDCRGKSSVFTRVRSRLDFIRDYSGVVPIVTKSNTTDPTPEEITTTTTSPFTCAGKKNGNYPNPASNCSANFYTCSNGYASLSACSSVLIYHAELDACDWHFNVAGCY